MRLPGNSITPPFPCAEDSTVKRPTSKPRRGSLDSPWSRCYTIGCRVARAAFNDRGRSKGVPMKRYEVDQLRNVVMLGGSRAGKTSLAEALLFTNGATSRLGSVDEGTSVLDFDPDEVARKLTLNTSLASIETPQGKINLLDTPGFSVFLGDSRAACRVADAALFVVSAATGIKFETEALWKAADENGLPRLIVVTKLDRERTSLAKVLGDAETYPRRASDSDPGADRRRGIPARRRGPAPRQGAVLQGRPERPGDPRGDPRGDRGRGCGRPRASHRRGCRERRRTPGEVPRRPAHRRG